MIGSLVTPRPYRFKPYCRALESSFMITLGSAMVILCLSSNFSHWLASVLSLATTWHTTRAIRALKQGQFLHASHGKAIGAGLANCVVYCIVTFSL